MKQVRIPIFRREEKYDLWLLFGPPRFFPELGPLGGRREVGPGIPGGFFPANRSASVPRRGHSFCQWSSPSQIAHLPRPPGRESDRSRLLLFPRLIPRPRLWLRSLLERRLPREVLPLSLFFFLPLDPWDPLRDPLRSFFLGSLERPRAPRSFDRLENLRPLGPSGFRPLEPSSFFTAFPSGSNPLFF